MTGKYQSLRTIFHRSQDGRKAAEAEFAARAGSPASLHWDFKVGQHDLFLVLTREIQARLEAVWITELRISHKWATLPGVAGSHYLTGLLIEEIKATNQIEGVHSTRKEIADALEKPSKGSHRRFREMAVLYQSLLSEERPPFPSSLEEVRRSYDSLLSKEVPTEELPDGRLFRSGPVGIHDGMKLVHQAPSSEEDVERRVETFLRAQESEEHLLVNALIGHFMFEYTHPFYDGNGRMGRFLLAFKALQILSPPTSMSLSHQFSVQRRKYYNAFSEVENELNYGEATFFLEAMLEMLTHAQEDLESSLDDKHSQLKVLRTVLGSLERSDYHRDLLFLAAQAHLFGPEKPIPLAKAAATMNRSWNTIRPIGQQLVDEGLLTAASKKPLTYMLTSKGRELLKLD